MGTRAIVGFRHQGEDLHTYNHYDGYPTYLGVKVAKFLREFEGKRDSLVHKLETNVRVDETQTCPVVIFEWLKSRGYTDEGVSSGVDWYAAMREAQGDLKKILDSGFFPLWKGGLSEDYAYIIDLDEDEFHIYSWGKKIFTFPINYFDDKSDEEIEQWADDVEELED